MKYTGLGGAPVFRGALRTILSVTPEKRCAVLYGSTEAEPISAIYATEKLELESSQPDGLCVGRPVLKGSTKVIKILKGTCSISSSTVLAKVEKLGMGRLNLSKILKV